MRVTIITALVCVTLAGVACGGALQATEYKAQLRACVDRNETEAEARACVQGVQDKWTEAGAPLATKDGGAE